MIRTYVHGLASATTVGILSVLAACSSTSGGAAGATDGGGAAQDDASTAGHDSGATPADSGSQHLDSGTSQDAASGSTLTIKIPSSFTGTTRQLLVVTEAALPPMGPPAGILYQAMTPQLTAGQKVNVTLDTSGTTGDYYVLVALYMQGGGMFSPKAGIDYQVATTMKVHFDGSAHDLGELDLALAQ